MKETTRYMYVIKVGYNGIVLGRDVYRTSHVPSCLRYLIFSGEKFYNNAQPFVHTCVRAEINSV